MFRTLCALPALLAFLALGTPETPSTVGPADDVSSDDASVGSLVHANTAFAVDMYRQLRSAEGNIFFSPYSISAALGMTTAGARGNTEREMGRALHFSRGFDPHAAFGELDNQVLSAARESKLKLRIANGLCLTGGDVSGEFRALLKDNYDAAFFRGGLAQINSWVKERTEGRIEKLLESLPSNSVCVVLNAIYFKGSWKSQFRTAQTRDAPFHLPSERRVSIPLMYQRGAFRLLENERFQAVSLPYAGGRQSMVILLPREVQGLAALEETMTPENLMQWLSQLDGTHERVIDLYLPRFRMDTDYDLVPACRNLGMVDAFLPDNADFSGMGWPPGDLWIAQIKHKAFVEVNEEGTEAAAATGVGMQTKSVQRYPSFRADHPFLFMIRDNGTGSILFMGRMSNPANT